jgi:hypothetical protein
MVVRVLERRDDRGGVCGTYAMPSFGHQNDWRKSIIEKIRCGLGRPPNIKYLTTTNQKHVRGSDGGIENDVRSAGSAGGARFDFEGIEYRGNEKIK